MDVLTITRASDTCFAIHTFSAVTTHPAYGASFTVDSARETSHIYLTALRTINGTVHFINTNNIYIMYTLTEVIYLTYLSHKNVTS